LQLHAGIGLEQLQSKIGHCAVSGDADRDRSGLLASELGELAHRTDLHAGIDH